MQAKSIALYGGSFDPIHLGHLQTADVVVQELGLDALYFMPNAAPPHKNHVAASYDTRVKMLQIALSEYGNEHFHISLFEQDPEKKHYTFNTLTEMQEKYPESELFFIMGMDSFVALDKWKRGAELIDLANIVVLKRPGSNVSELPASIQETMHGQHKHQYIFINNADIDISSTQIRTLLQQETKDYDLSGTRSSRLSQILLPKTLAFIKEQHLYS